MNTYIPLWSQITDSSLWYEPDFVVKVFLTMIVKRDMDDIVRGNAFHIANWSKKTEVEVLEAIKILSSPDTRRIEPQEYDGRRIEKVDGGYLILNGAHYRKQMQEANTRAYKRRKQAEYREVEKKKKKSNPLPGEPEHEQAIRNGATREESDNIVTDNLPKVNV